MPWAMIAMAAIQAVGSLMKGAAEFQANRQNTAYAEYEGKQARATAGAEADRTRYQVAAQQSALKATAGAQGTTFTGSPMEVYAQNALQGEQMAQDKIYQGELIHRAKKIEAANYKRAGAAALMGGVFGALGAGASAFAGGKAPTGTTTATPTGTG